MDGNNVLTRLHTKTELRTSSQLYPTSAMFFEYEALRHPLAARTLDRAGRREAGSVRVMVRPQK